MNENLLISTTKVKFDNRRIQIDRRRSNYAWRQFWQSFQWNETTKVWVPLTGKGPSLDPSRFWLVESNPAVAWHQVRWCKLMLRSIEQVTVHARPVSLSFLGLFLRSPSSSSWAQIFQRSSLSLLASRFVISLLTFTVTVTWRWEAVWFRVSFRSNRPSTFRLSRVPALALGVWVLAQHPPLYNLSHTCSRSDSNIQKSPSEKKSHPH